MLKHPNNASIKLAEGFLCVNNTEFVRLCFISTLSIHEKEEDEVSLHIVSTGHDDYGLHITFKGEQCRERASELCLAIRVAIKNEVKLLHGKL